MVQRFLALNIAPVIWTPSESGIPVFIAQIRTKAMMFFAVEQNFTNIVAQKRTKLFNPKFKSKSAFLLISNIPSSKEVQIVYRLFLVNCYTANVYRDLQGLCREIGVQGFQIYRDCMYTRNPCNF